MDVNRPVLLAAALLALPAAAGCFGKDAPAGLACADAAPPAPDPAWGAPSPVLRIDTTRGVLLARLDAERAPGAVKNVLDLAKNGVYDGTTFHRVVPGFVIQGGDPNTRNADPADDGLGGPGYAIRDEFNPTLRHDAEGVLGMASRGPDTAGSQFYITLAPRPQFDDRLTILGRLESGHETLRAIAAAPGDEDGRPDAPVRIDRVTETQAQPIDPFHAVLVTPLLANKTTEAGHAVTFAIAVRNLGNARDAIALQPVVPDGWTCRVSDVPTVPAGTGRIVFLTLTPPRGADGPMDVPIAAVGAWGARANATLHVEVGELGRTVRDGDLVTGEFVGALPDGRVFDTSLASVANAATIPKFDTKGGWQPRDTYTPFRFTVGAGVIEGFTDLATGAREGETVTGLVPAKDAYPTGNMYEDPLVGRDLVFELRIVRVGS